MGILANSASVTMTTSSADDVKAGFVVGEQVTISTNPAGTNYSWGIAKPGGATSRSDLSGTTGAPQAFTPDAPGTWVLTCVVDGTAYTLRITATAVAVVSVAQAHKLSPVTDNAVPAPAVGRTLYCGADHGNDICTKDPSGTVSELGAVVARATALEKRVTDLELGDMITSAQLGATWVLDPALFETDSTGTTVLAAGDGGGSGLVLASASGHEFTVDRTGPYGAVRASLRTNNTTGRLYSASGGVSGANSPFHILMVMRSASANVGVNGYDAFASFGAPVGGGNAGVTMGVGTVQSATYGAVGPTVKGLSYDGLAPTNAVYGKDYILEIQYDGTTLSFWIDGRRMSSLDVVVALTIADASLGFQNWITPSGSNPVGDTRIDAGFFKANGVIARSLVGKWLLRLCKVDLAGTAFIMPCVGDSWTSGGAVGTTPANYLPYAIRNVAADPYRIYPQNLGYSGQVAKTILESKWLPHNDPATHVHILWGVNDILAGTSAATIDRSTQDALARAEERGLKKVLGTIPEWGAMTDPQKAIRVAHNTIVRAYGAAGRASVADYDAKFGPYDPANFGDVAQLHPNDHAVTTIMAPEAYRAAKAA